MPALDPAREAYLLKHLQTGTPAERDAAFKSVFEATRASLFTLCLSLLGERTHAEDVVQEVFVQAFRAMPGFRGDARLSSWLYRIALRSALRSR